MLPTRGEVWLVDLGLVAKVRPGLVLSIPADHEHDRILSTILPHTTSTRTSRFEIRSDVGFLNPGAFDAQNIITVPNVKLIRKLGKLPVDQMALVEDVVKRWLGLEPTR